MSRWSETGGSVLEAIEEGSREDMRVDWAASYPCRLVDAFAWEKNVFRT